MRSFTPSDFQTDVSTEGTRGHIIVRAIDKEGKFVNRLNFEARVAGPSADASSPLPVIPLRQTAPGTYEGWFDAADIGTYLVNVTRNVANKPPEMTVTGLVVPYSPEYKDLTANEFLMTQLAQAGGGVSETNPAQAFGGNRPGAVSATDLSPLCLFLAMLLFPFDVAIRRVALDPRDVQKAKNWIRKRFGRKPIPLKNTATTPEMARLKDAKTRLQEKYKPSDKAQQEPETINPTRPAPSRRQPTPPSPEAEIPLEEMEELSEEPGAPSDDQGVAGMSRLMAAKQRGQEQQKREERERQEKN